MVGAFASDYTTTYVYDVAGNNTQVTNGLGQTTVTAYNATGQVATVTDPRTNATTYTYDPVDRIKTVTAPLQGVTTYNYTAGRMTSRVDALTRSTSYLYDLAGRVTRKTDPLGRFHTYTYDAAGNVATATDAVGNAGAVPNPLLGKTTFTYDVLNRVTNRTYGDSTSPVSYTYDPVTQNRASMVDGTGTTTYGYNKLGSYIRYTKTDGTSYTQLVDAAGNVTRRFYNGVYYQDYTYDDDNRPTKIEFSSVIAPGPTSGVSYQYDASSNPTHVRNLAMVSQPTSPSVVVGTQQYSYDRAGRVSQITNTNSTGIAAQYTYTRDANGNPTRINATGANINTVSYPRTLVYDTANRLTKYCRLDPCLPATAGNAYTYDVVGNRKTETTSWTVPTITNTLTHDNADQLISESTKPGVTYTYNSNGDLLTEAGRVYTYNSAHQTKSVTVNAGTPTAATTNYLYDGDGNRTSAISPTRTQVFKWNTFDPLPKIATVSDGAGVLSNMFRYGIGDQPVQIETGQFRVTQYLWRDVVGSITNYVSPTSGLVNATYGYDPFGASSPTNTLGYTGEMYDDVTGLYNLRARQYQTTSGRFTQTDPMPYGAGHAFESAYIYGYDNPMRFVDPSGKRGGECSYCDGDSIEYAHQFLKYRSPSELEALYDEYETMLKSIGEGSGPSGSDTHEVAMLLPRRTGQRGLPTLAWSKNAFDAITMIWAAAPKAAKLMQPKPSIATKGVDPNTIRFSQKTVNGLDPIEASMKSKGWVGEPIDVVRMPDGQLTSFDNTRLLAARNAGIEAQVRVHEFGDPFPAGRLGPNGPGTWGDAVTQRVNNQGAGFRTANPNGSATAPRAK